MYFVWTFSQIPTTRVNLVVREMAGATVPLCHGCLWSAALDLSQSAPPGLHSLLFLLLPPRTPCMSTSPNKPCCSRPLAATAVPVFLHHTHRPGYFLICPSAFSQLFSSLSSLPQGLCANHSSCLDWSPTISSCLLPKPRLKQHLLLWPSPATLSKEGNILEFFCV